MASSGTQNTDGYVLARTLAEVNRLNVQHFLWKKHVGWLLHPAIPRDRPDLSIADVGAGTGMWLYDLADDLPEASFTGFDIDLSQAPNESFLPPNTKLDLFDALKPLTPEIIEKYGGQFDIVNIRFFIWVIRDNDPTILLENCLKLLKPGGWLQWAEANMRHEWQYTMKASPDASDAPLSAIRTAFLPPGGPEAIPGAWIKDMHHHAAKAGFIHEQINEVAASSNNRTWAAMVMTTILSAYGNVIENMPHGEKKDALVKLHTDAAKAVKDGVIWGVNWITLAAQKPL